MFEPLISSRIRRTLLEYILAHSQERFYLRGLARRLNLSISPLRRELKRLEQLGVLTAAEEANVRMYVVNCASPYFVQLQSAATGQSTIISRAMEHVTPVAAPLPPPLLAGLTPRRVRSWPVVVSLAGLGVVMIGAMAYLALTNQQLLAVAKQAVTPAPRQPLEQAGVSGAMRGSRWQLLPGSFGGFSSSAESQESY